MVGPDRNRGQNTVFSQEGKMPKSMRLNFINLGLVCCLLWQTGCGDEELIQNPYHEKRLWRLWALDETPLTYRHGNREITVQLPPAEARLYPDDGVGESFLEYRDADWPERKYAGFWDDVYQSMDKGHSFIQNKWSDGEGNSVEIRNAMITLRHRADVRKFGVNFTSQSHASQGAPQTDLANNMIRTERDYYFQNVVRAAPAHKSYMDGDPRYTIDEYQALVPSYFNSIGASGSETMGLTKMVIAGGYLPRETKLLLKKHGHYPSALLYIWKAALPYDVPYAHEMRHLPAYFSAGNNRDTRKFTDQFNHHYDESLHLEQMVGLAKSMTVPPPLAILKTESLSGGKMIYDLKTSILVHQAPGEDIRLRISAEDSFDLLNKPMSFRLKVLHGNRRTRIEADPDGRTFTINVPADSQLPRGRTSILLIANNGHTDSNPAVINIFRTDKGGFNARPSLEGLDEQDILPGETVSAVLRSEDPRGQSVSLYRWQEDEGELDGNHFSWRSEESEPAGMKVFHFTASDGTGQSSFTSKDLQVNIRKTVASFTHDRDEGAVPLTVNFDAGSSRAVGNARLEFSWDFDDGQESTAARVSHTFTTPGFHQVKLTVRSKHGAHSKTVLIHAKPNWKLAVDNGWDRGKIDPAVWELASPETPVNLEQTTGTRLIIHGKGKEKGKFGLVTARKFSPPLYLEARFNYALTGGRRIEVFGHRLGSLPHEGPDVYGTPLFIGAGAGKETADWQKADIGSTYASYGHLKLYVTPDPRNKNRYRFRGTLQAGNKLHLIQFDNRELPDHHLAFYTQHLSSLFEVYQFQVWSPEGDVNRPDIAISSESPDDYYVQPEATRDGMTGRYFRPSSGAESVTHIFTIHNHGGSELHLQGFAPYLDISGANATDFRVTKAPEKVIPAGSETQFAVTFKPGGPGERSTFVSVSSNDPDEPRVRFQLVGRNSHKATLMVEANGLFLESGNNRPARSDATDFWRSVVGKSSGEHSFLIRNTGHSDLLITLPVRVTGANAGDFQITGMPRELIKQGEYSVLKVRFRPSAEGMRSARINIHSNSVDNSKFSIVVQGTGIRGLAAGIEDTGTGLRSSTEALPPTSSNTESGREGFVKKEGFLHASHLAE